MIKSLRILHYGGQKFGERMMSMDEKKIIGEDLTIAPGVIETMVSLAVRQVDGVAQMGSLGLPNSFMSAFTKDRSTQGVLIIADDNDDIIVDVHVLLYFGYRLHDVGNEVRLVVADTLSGQVGIQAAKINVFIDGIRFPEQ